MPQSFSDLSLVSPIHLEDSEIVLRDDELEEEDTVLDIEEYTCTNREGVNLENAAVNIDNSNDVIIGPVTQFNVSGNVTIYQNGTREQEAIDGHIANKEEESNTSNSTSTDGAKLGKVEKTESEEKDLKELNKRTKYVQIFLSISFATTVLVGIIFTIIYAQKAEDYTPDDSNNDTYIGDHQVLDRTKWNGRPPLSEEKMITPVSLVIIKHTGGGTCGSFQECAGKLQTIQSQAVSKGFPDIYYSFMIGGDGNIYVGRGWDVQPQQRNDTIDIAFMGSFTFDVPTSEMISAAQLLLLDGVQNFKLTKDYKVVCHNQTTATESPGLNLIEEVRKWPHYDPGLYFSDALKKATLFKT